MNTRETCLDQAFAVLKANPGESASHALAALRPPRLQGRWRPFASPGITHGMRFSGNAASDPGGVEAGRSPDSQGRPHLPDSGGVQAPAPRPRITVEELRVLPDRVAATVRTGDAVRVLTTPKLLAAICARHPDLPAHACVNGEGPTFGAVMNRTPLPHLLEHLVIDLQVRAGDDAERVFTGATRWIDRPAGIARVEVSYADDLVALRAFRDAADLINSVGR